MSANRYEVEGRVFYNRIDYEAALRDLEKIKEIKSSYDLKNAEDIKEVYHKLFDEALERYNAKQKRKDRCIENYYEKIRQSKQEKPFYEVIFQIGNKDDMGAATENGQLAATILDQFLKDFVKRNPQLYVYSAHLHMDEATPHLHIDFIPFTTGSTRGLSTRVSLKQALADQGIKGEGRSMTERDLWVQREKEALAGLMLEHGIEWEQKDEHREHLSVLEYKKEQRAQELAEVEQTLEKAKQQKVAVREVAQIEVDTLGHHIRREEHHAVTHVDDCGIVAGTHKGCITSPAKLTRKAVNKSELAQRCYFG